MKFIPKYITTDILAEYGEHLTHEAYNEMVKLNSSQGDHNTKVLNQLFNTDEGIQIPYLDNKINKVTNDQVAINKDMRQVVANMAALAGSLSKYSTIIETRRMIQYATQDFVKTNKIKAGENVEVVVDALNNVIISATGGGYGDVTKAYVDEQDTATLQSSKIYTDTQIAGIPIPIIPTNISAFVNDIGYITDYTETDPIFGASPAASIESSDITNWNSKQEELVSGTNIKTINNIPLLGSGNIDIQVGTSDYNYLENKPQINNVILEGNKTLEDLGYIPYDDTNLITLINQKANITDIPTDAHINELIDSKLGVIENAYY